MKILIIMGGFFPGKNFGGPPVSVNNFCTLMNEDKCYIVTKNHDYRDYKPYEDINTNIWNKRDNCYVKYLSEEKYNKKEFETTILEVEPDIIYLQGLFQSCILPCLELAKKYSIKVVLAPRGELCEGAFKKKYKKLPYIMYLRIRNLLSGIYYQSTSIEESNSIRKYLKVEYKKIYSLTNIPSIPKKRYIHDDKKKGSAKFIFLSRVHHKKNLISAIEYFKYIDGNIVFDIYGPIEDKKYWEQCKQKIKELPDNITVKYCGLVSHENVHKVFSQYDAFLFPTFSENYGHVIAEALSVGTKVIISDQTPWIDLDKYNAGWVIPINNDNEFKKVIQYVVNQSSDESKNQIEDVYRYIERKIDLKSIRIEYKKLFGK